MPALEERNFVTVEDYLAGELVSETKHEYLGGVIHAMAEGTANHSTVISNLGASLSNSLIGKPCRHFTSDFKVRIELSSQTRFYYPDTTVACGPINGDSQFIDNPVVIAEVLSPGTRRVDLSEKKEAYLSITSLKVLLLLEPDEPHVIVHRRSPNGGFDIETYHSRDAEIPLPEIEASLPLSRLYDRIDIPSGQ